MAYRFSWASVVQVRPTASGATVALTVSSVVLPGAVVETGPSTLVPSVPSRHCHRTVDVTAAKETPPPSDALAVIVRVGLSGSGSGWSRSLLACTVVGPVPGFATRRRSG